MIDLEKVLLNIVKPLCSDQDSVMVKQMESLNDNELLLYVYAPSDDIARLIGKKGMMANSIRQMLQVASRIENVVIGKILNTFGIKGELKVAVYSDFPEERFASDSTIYIGEGHLPFTVDSYRMHKGMMLLLLKDNHDINLVERYKGMVIYKSKDDIAPLPEGEYYFSDLCDLDVYVEDIRIGRVLGVEEGLRNNNLRILSEEDGKEHLVPFLPVFVKDVDLQNGRIDIVKMEGLL